MKLIGTTTSPFVRKVRILLRAAELPFDLLDTRTPAGAEALAALSPLGKMPVLLTDGDPGALLDSKLILSWLWSHHEAVFRNAGFVLDQTDWEDRMRVEIVEGALDAALNRMYLRKEGAADTGYVGKQRARVRTCFEWLDGRIVFAKPVRPSALALGCFLDWGLFRQTVDLAPHEGLQRFHAEWIASGVGAGTEPHE